MCAAQNAQARGGFSCAHLSKSVSFGDGRRKCPTRKSRMKPGKFEILGTLIINDIQLGHLEVFERVKGGPIQ
jgi:hypothetical protein